MRENLKEYFQQRFDEVFGEGFRLLAVHLDGFSHSVIYDKGTSDSGVMSKHSSAYTPIDPMADKIFKGIPHYSYQNNAKEIVYITPQER